MKQRITTFAAALLAVLTAWPTPMAQASATADALQVTLERATAWRSRSKLGRIKANGTLRVVGGRIDLQQLVVTVSDEQGLEESGEFSSCRGYPSGTLRCQNDDRSARIRYVPDASEPGLYRFKLDYRRRAISPPQVAPLRIEFEYAGLWAGAENEPCQAFQAKLVCRGSSVDVLTPVATAAMETLNEIRINVLPACDPGAAESPCAPENGERLPPVRWRDALAQEAAAITDTCPVFHPPGFVGLLFVQSSPSVPTETELLEQALQVWASKRAQYSPYTGDCLRQGDTSCHSYKALLTADEVGIAVEPNCPNNRTVVVMAFRPALPAGPAYPPVPPSCEDDYRNQDESDVDCGGICGPTCEHPQSCRGDTDCVGGSCQAGTCAPVVACPCFTEQSVLALAMTHSDAEFRCSDFPHAVILANVVPRFPACGLNPTASWVATTSQGTGSSECRSANYLTCDNPGSILTSEAEHQACNAALRAVAAVICP